MPTSTVPLPRAEVRCAGRTQGAAPLTRPVPGGIASVPPVEQNEGGHVGIAVWAKARRLPTHPSPPAAGRLTAGLAVAACAAFPVLEVAALVALVAAVRRLEEVRRELADQALLQERLRIDEELRRTVGAALEDLAARGACTGPWRCAVELPPQHRAITRSRGRWGARYRVIKLLRLARGLRCLVSLPVSVGPL